MRRYAGTIALVCFAIVAFRALSAPSPDRPANKADPSLRATLAADIASRETGWRAGAQEVFPADNWSQSDDFHARESQRMRELAGDNGVPIEDVLRAVDEDLHRLPRDDADARGARAVPCKPRPFYD